MARKIQHLVMKENVWWMIINTALPIITGLCAIGILQGGVLAIIGVIILVVVIILAVLLSNSYARITGDNRMNSLTIQNSIRNDARDISTKARTHDNPPMP